MKILLVDDSVLFRDVVGGFLGAEGHEVVTARSGHEGLELATRARPDLIFLDSHIGGVCGQATRRALSRYSRTRGIPVVMMTPETHFEDLEPGVDHIIKPVTATVLAAKVATYETE